MPRFAGGVCLGIHHGGAASKTIALVERSRNCVLEVTSCYN